METFYHSTRGCGGSVTSKQAIRAGIAPDGGLYVSDQLGDRKLDLSVVTGQGYRQTACQVLSTLLPDFSDEQVKDCVAGAYGDTFDSAAVTPVSPLGHDWLLELYHGPTCAFKDVALQMLPRLMTAARDADGPRIMIVTATSGDTGKAALAGFAGVEGCGVTVFYPEGKVSETQHLQMATQTGRNVAVCGVTGTFDDCQAEVKRIFADVALRDELAAGGVALSSANSINVGRLAPQVVYYVDAYAQLVRRGAVTLGEAVDFCVPTGNFGDVLAGYFAKRMGLPVGRLVVASNTNKVLTDFLATGIYDRRRAFVKTISPSMDILVSSNLERMLYYLTNGDVEQVAAWMGSLAREGVYDIGATWLARLRETFDGDFATDAETSAAIRAAWEDEGVLIDPHTAVASCVLRRRAPERRQRVCLSTANPYKFSADVLAALGVATQGMSDFACMDELQDLTGICAPPQLRDLRSAPIAHDSICERGAMKSFLSHACARIFR